MVRKQEGGEEVRQVGERDVDMWALAGKVGSREQRGVGQHLGGRPVALGEALGAGEEVEGCHDIKIVTATAAKVGPGRILSAL